MEDLKSIKLELDYFDEDGVRSMKQMSIKVNKPKVTDKPSLAWESSHAAYDLTFSLVIPDHVHAFLLGKSVPASDLGRNVTRDYEPKFSKTINADSIKTICERYWIIMSDYKFLKDIDKAELTKVIFYDFNNASRQYVSEWNSTLLGKTNNLNFLYAIGYTSNVRGKLLRYNEQKMVIAETYNRNFYAHSVVKWTEDRQLFFEDMQLSFEKWVNGINAFKEGLKEETIDFAIKNKVKYLGA